MNSAASSDPFQVLGLSPDADETEVRTRYLELVKQFSPDREAEKFREIRAAYEATKDPLSIARRLTTPPDESVPLWTDALKEQQPPRLTPAFLLSLGNRLANAPSSSG
jgi:hypothetical protein